MSQQVASLYAEIGAKVDGFEKGAASVKSGMSGMASQFSSVIPSSIMQFTSLGGAAMAVGAALYGLEQAADEAARGDARLEAVLKSTGEAAGYNFSQLDQMATGLSKVSGVDDDLIKKSMAVEATFTSIAGDVFPKAAQAALDLSAVLGGDLQGATIQVDKALNDFSGYTALKRAGVSFSETQIEQIKNFKATNDLAGYQNLILNELTKEFGGAAAAIHEAGDNSEDVSNAWGNLTVQLGSGLTPMFRDFNKYLVSSIDGWSSFIAGLTNGNTALSSSNDWLTKLMQAYTAPTRAIADWIGLTQKQTETQATFDEQVAAQVDVMMKAAEANTAYVPTAEEVEAANKAISEANISMVGTIQSMQDAEDSYAKSSLDLASQREEARVKAMEALAKDGADTAQINSDYQAKLTEIAQQEADLAAERDKQTLQFISNILLQKLEVDGFTTAEFEAFAKQQEAWGLWSADTVAKAQAAWSEADKVAASISAIPSQTPIAIDVNTTYTQTGNPPYLPGSNGYNERHAAGGLASGLAWVGENGPELVNLPNGSYVNSNPASKEMMRNANVATSGNGGSNSTQTSFDYDRMAQATALAVRDALLTMDRR